MIRIGQGYDIHRLVRGRKLIIGGVIIPNIKGEAGHSDGDVLIHAVIDALLGAAAMGDIGEYFPPSDPKWKNIDSGALLSSVMEKISDSGWSVINLDCTVILQKPKLSPHKIRIRDNLAKCLSLEPSYVCIKGKTKEKCDAVGKGRAVEALASVLLTRD